MRPLEHIRPIPCLVLPIVAVLLRSPFNTESAFAKQVDQDHVMNFRRDICEKWRLVLQQTIGESDSHYAVSSGVSDVRETLENEKRAAKSTDINSYRIRPEQQAKSFIDRSISGWLNIYVTSTYARWFNNDSPFVVIG